MSSLTYDVYGHILFFTSGCDIPLDPHFSDQANPVSKTLGPPPSLQGVPRGEQFSPVDDVPSDTQLTLVLQYTDLVDLNVRPRSLAARPPSPLANDHDHPTGGLDPLLRRYAWSRWIRHRG
jgi:hypothetical protein